MKKYLFILLLLFTLPCYSATLTYTNTLTNATTADADEVMANFNDAKTFVEAFDGANITAGTIVNSAVSASAQIDSSKIEGSTTDVNLQTFNSNFRQGCRIVYEAVGNVTVTAGEVMINGKYRRNTSATDSAWTAASTTASGLDTGSEASSTTYYVWLCADDPNASTFTVVLATSSSAPSYTGATNYRKIGSIYNDASSNINNIINTGTDGPKVASGKFVGGTTSVTVTLGFQPIWVRILKGDADPANDETVEILETTYDMEVDGLNLYDRSATTDWTTDSGSPGINTFTTTGFTVQTTNTHIYYYVALGY